MYIYTYIHYISVSSKPSKTQSVYIIYWSITGYFEYPRSNLEKQTSTDVLQNRSS